MSESDEARLARIKKETPRTIFGDKAAELKWADFEFLVDLAARGAAVKRRPIEEAPKDGTPLLLYNGKTYQTGKWDRVDSAWVASIKTITKRVVLPTPPVAFIPISALGETPATGEQDEG